MSDLRFFVVLLLRLGRDEEDGAFASSGQSNADSVHIEKGFDELGGKGGLHWARGDEGALFEGDEVVCEGGNEVDIVEDDNDGGAMGGFFSSQPQGGKAVGGVERGNRLIKEHDGGGIGRGRCKLSEDASELHTLLFSTRKSGVELRGFAEHIDLREGFPNDVGVFGVVNRGTVGDAAQRDDFLYREGEGEGTFLGEDGAKAGEGFRGPVGQGAVIEKDGARVWVDFT